MNIRCFFLLFTLSGISAPVIASICYDGKPFYNDIEIHIYNYTQSLNVLVQQNYNQTHGYEDTYPKLDDKKTVVSHANNGTASSARVWLQINYCGHSMKAHGEYSVKVVDNKNKNTQICIITLTLKGLNITNTEVEQKTQTVECDYDSHTINIKDKGN